MKFPKNLLAASFLAFAIATTTLAGDVGFPPAPPPPPASTVPNTSTAAPVLLTEALLALISVFQ